VTVQLLETDMPYHNKSQEAMEWAICKDVNTFQFDVRASDTKRLGVGGFLTEFGAETQDTDGLNVRSIVQRDVVRPVSHLCCASRRSTGFESGHGNAG